MRTHPAQTLPPSAAASTSTWTSIVSARQLRRRYIFALLLIALLTVASQAIMQYLIADQSHDSRIVNIAGRQRMLSQKLVKTSYYLSHAASSEAATRYRDQLAETLGLWQHAHAGLLHGDPELGLPGANSPDIVALFAEIEPHHRAMVAAARSILTASDFSPETLLSAIQELSRHEPNFLKGMDAIAFRYDREAKEKIEKTRRLELGLMGLTLLVLALEAAFIFAPATRRIQRDMQAMADHEQDMEHLFEGSPTAMLLVDMQDHVIVRANQKAADLMGIPTHDLAATRLDDYLDNEYEANQSFLKKVAQGEALNEYEVIVLDARKSVVESLASVRQITFSGHIVYILGITNISELKRAQHSLQYFATFDELTGLVNRRTGLMQLAKAVAHSRRDGSKLAVCFLDLDNLKTTNDTYGHEQGDWLIRTLAEVLTDSIRAGDTALRLGGDEFLLILHNCPADEAERLVARINARLVEIGKKAAKPFPLSVSAGAVVFDPERHASPEELVSEADNLMYRSKQGKKNHTQS